MCLRLEAHPAILAREEERRCADIVLKGTAKFLQDTCTHQRVVEYAGDRFRRRLCLRCRLYRDGYNHHELTDRMVELIDTGFFELRLDQ